jgi:hypothetical protein
VKDAGVRVMVEVSVGVSVGAKVGVPVGLGVKDAVKVGVKTGDAVGVAVVSIGAAVCVGTGVIAGGAETHPARRTAASRQAPGWQADPFLFV